MESKANEFLQKPIIVINLGLKKFAESLEEQQIEIVQMDWIPPAGGDQEMMELLDQLLTERYPLSIAGSFGQCLKLSFYTIINFGRLRSGQRLWKMCELDATARNDIR